MGNGSRWSSMPTGSTPIRSVAYPDRSCLSGEPSPYSLDVLRNADQFDDPGKPVDVDAVLLLSFGGPEGPDDVMPFLRNVTAGRNVPDARLAVVAEQYALFGGKSPINELSRQLVVALQRELDAADDGLPVYWGTRNWQPSLADTVAQMADDGIKRALVFTNSAFASYSGCRQYLEDLDRARTAVGANAPQLDKLRLYFNHPGFIEPMIEHTRSAIAEHRLEENEGVHLLFTAHSLPQGMADACDYEEQLRNAMALVVGGLANCPIFDHELVFQSRSGAPHMPWLGPDVLDHLETLAASGANRPLTLVPLGFTADHMEVVFDLDVQAASRAKELGISITRAKTVGTTPPFVTMIRQLIEEQTKGTNPEALGALGPLPNHTDDQHCLPSVTAFTLDG